MRLAVVELEQKKSFVMYTDYWKHIKLLNQEQRGDLLSAIMLYATSEELPQMDGMTQMAFSFIKEQMDRDSEKYQTTLEKRKEAGKMGGRPVNGDTEKAKKANGFLENQMVSAEKQTKAKKPDTDNVNDNDTDTVIKKESVKKKATAFSPPTRQEVADYVREKGYSNVDVERFIDYYTANGWMVGKNKMKDWKATVRNWARSEGATKPNNTKGNKFLKFEQRDYDYDAIEKKLLT